MTERSKTHHVLGELLADGHLRRRGRRMKLLALVRSVPRGVFSPDGWSVIEVHDAFGRVSWSVTRPKPPLLAESSTVRSLRTVRSHPTDLVP